MPFRRTCIDIPKTSIVAFTVAIPLAFIASLLWVVLHKRRQEGQIRLEEGDSPTVHPHVGARQPAAPAGPGNHEVSSDVWG
jgi:hypothetical protein